MKRLLSLALILCAVVGVASAQFRYSALAGVNVNTLNFKQDLVSVDQSVGYQAGVQGELMFPGLGFGLDLGLLYNQMGAKVNLGERKIWASQGIGTEHVYLHYVQIPFHLRFKWTRMNGLEDYISPLVYGGPDFTILAAHGNSDAFKYAGGELGLTVGFGFELFRNWQVTAAHTWGMTYALKTQLLDDFSARNGQWAVRVARFF